MDEVGRLRHFAVVEYDDLRVEWFYKRLGFESCVQVEFPEENYIDNLSGGVLKDVSIRKLANAFGSIVEIIRLPQQPIDSCAAWSHVAISVDSCLDLVEELVSNGALLVGGPVQSPSGPYLVAYVRDPAGNLVELVERLSI